MTADFGEWEADAHEYNAPSSSPATATVAAALAAVDVDTAIHDAVRTVVRKRLEAVAAAAVDATLDEPTRAQLRQVADEAARRALHQPAAPDDAGSRRELYYPNVAEFVTQQLAPMYRRALTGQSTTWCPEWWRHAEAIARLEALWRAWEHLRLDPATGMSLWFRDHADHHMAVLLNADGPFKGCKPDRHAERLPALPSTPPPAGLFDAR